MGRGDRRTSPRDVPGGVAPPPRYAAVLADEAMDELIELLTYIKGSSPKNAATVNEAISWRLFQLGRDPRIGHADPNALLAPPGATALITTVKKISIYYLFPMARVGREIVLVLSVRRGSRMPLEQPEYARRWLEELARITPSSDEPSQATARPPRHGPKDPGRGPLRR